MIQELQIVITFLCGMLVGAAGLITLGAMLMKERNK